MKNTDATLIHRTLDGDDNAFAELVKKYQKQVHALIWRKIGDFHVAEELTQDVFLKAYQGLATLKKPQSFVSWLYVIASNDCSTWLRKKRLWTQSLEDTSRAKLEKATYSGYVIQENERASSEAQRDVVQKLLAKLQESERTVMTLHYFGEMTCKKISEFLKIGANLLRQADGQVPDPAKIQVPPPINNDKPIFALAFSSDGAQLASGSIDTTIRLWNTTSGDELIALRRHTGKGWTTVLAFSPNGKILASGSTDSTVELWDATTGEPRATLTGHINSITSLAFSRNGTLLASASADGMIRFWNTETGTAIPNHITGHTKGVKSVTFFKDSSTLATAAFNRIITFWDLETSGVNRPDSRASGLVNGISIFTRWDEIRQS